MLCEVVTIAAAIPHDDLCIPWDVCLEMVLWDRQPVDVPPVPEIERDLPARLCALCDAVPSDVEVGLHLCYAVTTCAISSSRATWRTLVDLATAIAAAATHTLAYVHRPVPLDRDDDAYSRRWPASRLIRTRSCSLA